jgi:hypothetical protein
MDLPHPEPSLSDFVNFNFRMKRPWPKKLLITNRWWNELTFRGVADQDVVDSNPCGSREVKSRITIAIVNNEIDLNFSQPAGSISQSMTARMSLRLNSGDRGQTI